MVFCVAHPFSDLGFSTMILDPSAPGIILSMHLAFPKGMFHCRKLAVFHHFPSGVMQGLGGMRCMYVHVKLVIVEQACIHCEMPENVY